MTGLGPGSRAAHGSRRGQARRRAGREGVGRRPARRGRRGRAARRRRQPRRRGRRLRGRPGPPRRRAARPPGRRHEGGARRGGRRVRRASHVLVVGHPYVDVWQAVRPGASASRRGRRSRAATPGRPACRRAPGLAARDEAELRCWRRILGTVATYAELEPELLGRGRGAHRLRHHRELTDALRGCDATVEPLAQGRVVTEQGGVDRDPPVAGPRGHDHRLDPGG